VRKTLVELVHFTLRAFDLADQGAATLLGPELMRLMVDTSQLELVAMQRDVERRANKLAQEGRLGLASLRDLAI